MVPNIFAEIKALSSLQTLDLSLSYNNLSNCENHIQGLVKALLTWTKLKKLDLYIYSTGILKEFIEDIRE